MQLAPNVNGTRRGTSLHPFSSAASEAAAVRLPASRTGWKEHLDRCLDTHRAGQFDRPESPDLLTRERKKLARLWAEDRAALLKRSALIFVLIPLLALLASWVMNNRAIVWEGVAVSVVTMILGLWSASLAIFFQSPRASSRRHDLMPATLSYWRQRQLSAHPGLLKQIEILKNSPFGLLQGDKRVIEKYMADLKRANR